MDMIFLNRVKAVNASLKCDDTEKRSSRRHRRFTALEATYLRETEGQYSATELSAEMGYKVGSIRDKAQRMGIKLKGGWVT